MKMRKPPLFVVNEPAFFISHRLPVAIAIRQARYKVHVATVYGRKSSLNPCGWPVRKFLIPLPFSAKGVEHQSGGHNWSYYLWGVMLFQQWQELNV
jgi:hypothetical protein